MATVPVWNFLFHSPEVTKVNLFTHGDDKSDLSVENHWTMIYIVGCIVVFACTVNI